MHHIYTETGYHALRSCIQAAHEHRKSGAVKTYQDGNVTLLNATIIYVKQE